MCTRQVAFWHVQVEMALSQLKLSASSNSKGRGPQRRLWSDENMIVAVKSVEDEKGLREAARLYNMPIETLRR